jgi:hypothetical protein
VRRQRDHLAQALEDARNEVRAAIEKALIDAEYMQDIQQQNALLKARNERLETELVELWGKIDALCDEVIIKDKEIEHLLVSPDSCYDCVLATSLSAG